jgi:UDP-N-acetylglucosamine--N-acetylmuramyl-(pentapeptide) pyrophosphoryl-undecaprenol N-acetylglucosamine transferase
VRDGTDRTVDLVLDAVGRASSSSQNSDLSETS